MKKTTVRNFLIRSGAFFSLSFRSEKPRLRVLALHDVSENEKNDFIKKMQWLKQHYNVVSLRSAYEKESLNNSRLNIVITFDDGFKNYFSLVSPILHEFSLPATFFIPSGVIGISGERADFFTLHNLGRHGKFDFISEEDLLSLSKDPLFEIGGHTKNHINLGMKLSEEMVIREIKDDKNAIEKIIGKPINFFAYPFGGIKDICKDSARYLRDAGYKASFTILPSFWRRRDNLFFIGRDCLSLDESNEIWAARLSGGYDFVSRLKNFLLG